jgi:ACS family D-galactonate transporter-like MFS transporter
MFNFIGNVSSIATPIVIRFLVTDIDFASSFVYMTTATIVGVLPCVFLVGKVERVQERPESTNVKIEGGK